MKNYLYLALAMILLISCSKDTKQTIKNDGNTIPKDEVTKAIHNLGFSTKDLYISGDTIIVEGDILLLKSKLLRKSKNNTIPRQAVIKNATLEKSNIKIWISNNFTNSEQEVIKTSLNAFIKNAIGPNIGISGLASITYTSAISVSDCSIQAGNLSSNSCGMAEFPEIYNGTISPLLKLGKSMQINHATFKTLNTAQKKLLITHEFGHMIGLRHTNWRLLANESEFSTNNFGQQIGAYRVPGTNNTDLDPDPGSVFNGAKCGLEFTGFTENDQRAIIYLTNGTYFL
ncbi:M57 family metalloprotease [Sphingobacterium sp. MYb382]|uniref:M57 family metalloprotease n=1 Tax=Sphingobacterium sp. MYb382 TaxID=2745278 RepID=UPI00309B09CC